MATPVIAPLTAVDTAGALVSRVIRRVNEPMTSDQIADVYNDLGDAIESIWMSAILATLSKFTKGPVTQLVTEQTTYLVSVPDPTYGPSPSQQSGSALAARTAYFSYCLVTDSGSTTNLSPLAVLAISANNIAILSPPLNPSSQDIPDGVVGWYPFAGYNPDGSDQAQQSPVPLPFNQNWYEPPAGLSQAPNAPAPPSSNTTGDNIFSIKRIDVQNVDQTWTQWIQATMGGTWWTEFQHRIATTTTWMPFVFDLIDGKQLEVRPAPAYAESAVYFYIARPRRPRFPQSRLPFKQIVYQAFLFKYCMAQALQSLYEFEASDRWKKDAEEERVRIMMSINASGWDQNTTVRPFMR